MTLFWGAAALLIITALSMVIPALLGRRRSGVLGRDLLNRAVYRDRMAELDAAHADASLDHDAFAEARIELEAAMLADVPAPGETPVRAAVGRPHPVMAVVAAVGIPLVAFGIYLQLGNLDALAGVSSAAPTVGSAHAGSGQSSLDKMVAKLETRLRKDPNDAAGWLMLARSYAFMKRGDAARDAFAHAYRLTPKDVAVLVSYAETLTRIAHGRVSDQALELLNRALRINPRMQPALWLSGMGAFQRDDKDLALQRWKQLRGIGGLNSKDSGVLDRFIARAGGGDSAAALTATSTDQSAGARGRIEVHVAIAPELRAAVAADDIVFVYARAAKGPPMPLAVARRKVAELPFTVVLDDSMAMVPQMHISAFPAVVVGARVSKSGTSVASSGDLQGVSAPLKLADAGRVDLSIAQVVP